MKYLISCLTLFLMHTVSAQTIRLDLAKKNDIISTLENACSAGSEESNEACLEQLERMRNQLATDPSLNLSSIVASICYRYAMPYINEMERPLTYSL